MRDSTEVAGLITLGEARRLGGLTILAESTRDDPRKIFIRITPQKKVTRLRRRKIVDKRGLSQ